MQLLSGDVEQFELPVTFSLIAHFTFGVTGALAVPAIWEAGVGLFFGGIVVTLVPLIAGLYFGLHVLKVNPLLLLGGLAGAQTFTPGLAAVQEKSSAIAVLGYSGSVAIAHVLLPMWGSVIVLLIGGGATLPPA